jgi:hypothetical protein
MTHRSTLSQLGLIAAGLSLTLGACLGDPAGESLTGVEKVSSALTNTLNENGVKTSFNAQVAIGAASDHVLAVWTAKDSAGNPQIVGQPFGSSTGDPYGSANPVLQVLSATPRPKSWPATAWDDNFENHFLIVWQDDKSSTDSDIYGAVVNDQGLLIPTAGTNPFVINNDTDNEKMPTVTWVSDYGEFLVTYTRKVNAQNRTALTSQYVSSDGTVDFTLMDAVPSGVRQTASRPTTAFLSGGEILFTWNDNLYGWAPIEDAIIYSVNSISGAAGLVGASNDWVNSFGLAWHTGNLGTSQIMAQVFPNFCEDPSCAAAAVNPMSAGGGVTNLHYPVIAAADQGYGIFVGTEQTTWHIEYAEVGPASGSNGSVTPNCAGALQSQGGKSLGSSGGTIAAASAPNPLKVDQLEFLMYDSFCLQSAKELVAAPDPATPSNVLTFNVSM